MAKHKLDSYYLRKYGVPYSYYEKLWAEQNEKCALCKKPRKPGQKRFHLDHSHQNQKIRGILCYYCNRRRVGQLTYDWAFRIAEYLYKYE